MAIILVLIGILAWQVNFKDKFYNNTLSCEDSDGLDYYVKGKTTYYNPEDSENTELILTTGTYDDFCVSDFDFPIGKELTEYYCEGDQLRTEIYTCSIACQDGACLGSIAYSPEELEVRGVVFDFYYCYLEQINLQVGFSSTIYAEAIEYCGNYLLDTYKKSGPNVIPYSWQEFPGPQNIVIREVNIGEAEAFVIVYLILDYPIKVELILKDNQWNISDIEATE